MVRQPMPGILAAMRIATLLLLAWLAPATGWANECEAAAHAAEREARLPPDILVAIGRVESGRRGGDGRVAPWPWSVNAAGEGHYLGSAAEAVALVRTLHARGIQSIDVGCFQVNLAFHPQSFTNLEDAFDPASNARAAAAFLVELRATTTRLEDAVGRYHSADPARGVPYAHQVMASWLGGAAMAAPPVSQVAALVRVFVPGGNAANDVRAFGRRLPVVIVPGGARL